MYRHYENTVTITRKDCSQLFFIYTGLKLRVGKVPALDFLKKTGLSNRNIVLMRDPYRAGFQLGITEAIHDLKSLIDWQASQVLPHVREIYCIGNSGGALAALVAGHRLKARTVWSFATSPPPRKRWLYPPGRERKEVDNELLSSRIGESNFDRFDRRLDLEALDEAVRTLSEDNGVTDYRLYYVSSNEPDSFVQECLSKCPRATPCAVEAPPEWSERDRRKNDHLVLSILNARNELSTLIPAFASAQ
jgi:hypothetical protein